MSIFYSSLKIPAAMQSSTTDSSLSVSPGRGSLSFFQPPRGSVRLVPVKPPLSRKSQLLFLRFSLPEKLQPSFTSSSFVSFDSLSLSTSTPLSVASLDLPSPPFLS